jgi:hypothetical protein
MKGSIVLILHLQAYILPLDIWTNSKLFDILRDKATIQQLRIIKRCHEVRDDMLVTCKESGDKIRALPQIRDKIQQGFPPATVAELGDEIKSERLQNQLETKVMVRSAAELSSHLFDRPFVRQAICSTSHLCHATYT